MAMATTAERLLKFNLVFIVKNCYINNLRLHTQRID